MHGTRQYVAVAVVIVVIAAGTAGAACRESALFDGGRERRGVGDGAGGGVARAGRVEGAMMVLVVVVRVPAMAHGLDSLGFFPLEANLDWGVV